jgi:RNA polymerase sigma factor (sigma-70 family)
MPDKFVGDTSFSSVSQVPVLDSEATVSLVARAKSGDEAALQHLLDRCLPALRRWAHGRLPALARSDQPTVDFVHDTVLEALRKLDRLEARREGALQAYLRQALHTRIVELIAQSRLGGAERSEDATHAGPSPFEAAIGAESAVRYEAALLRLRDEDREAIIGRVELLYSYEELAVALEKPTANAARLAVTRALQRLAEKITAA